MVKYLKKLPAGWFLSKDIRGEECLQVNDDTHTGTFLRLFKCQREWVLIRCHPNGYGHCGATYTSLKKLLAAMYEKK